MNPSLYASSNASVPSKLQGSGYQVTPNQILSLSEVELVNKIVALGAQYRLIRQFLDRYAGIGSQDGGLAQQLAYGKSATGFAGEGAKKQAAGGGAGGLADSDGGDEDDQEEGSMMLNGVYIKAFCSGVNELITIYKEHILTIEREYLKDRSLTVLSLQ